MPRLALPVPPALAMRRSPSRLFPLHTRQSQAGENFSFLRRDALFAAHGHPLRSPQSLYQLRPHVRARESEARQGKA